MEESLKALEGEDITLEFDGRYSARICEDFIKAFGFSEVLSFVVHSNKKQFYFDGVTCGLIEENNDNFDLRMGKVTKRNFSTTLDINCVINLCFVCTCGNMDMIQGCCFRKYSNCVTCHKDTFRPCSLIDNCYGVMKNSKITLLQIFKNLIKFGKGNITFKVEKKNSISNNDRTIFNTIASNRGVCWRKKVGANSFTLNNMLRLLFVANNLENWKKRCSVTGKLRRWLKTKFGVKSERIVLKVSFHKTIHFGILNEILEILIFNTPLSHSVKKSLLRESRVIQVSRKKLGEFLCNHIQAAKEFKNGKKPKCICENVNGNHIDGSDITLFSTDIQHVFSFGGNFVPNDCK